MDITFEDVAHVIQDARYQQAILDTTPKPDKRIPALPRGFNAQQYIEKYEVRCGTVMEEPLGRWFLDKFADLDDKVREQEQNRAPGPREETRFLNFVSAVYELRKQDPESTAPFFEVLRLLRDYKLDELNAVNQFLSDAARKPLAQPIESAMSEAYSSTLEEELDAIDLDDIGIEADPGDLGDTGDEEVGSADSLGDSVNPAADGDASGAVEAKAAAGGDAAAGEAVDANAAAGPGSGGRGGDTTRDDMVRNETQVSRYEPGKTVGQTTRVTGATRARTTAGGGRMMAMVMNHRQASTPQRSVRSQDLNKALQALMEALVQPIYDRFAANKQAFAQYLRFKLFAHQPIGDRQIRYHRVLGQGAFGTVHGCIVAQTGTMLAMKIMSKKKIKIKHSKSQVVAERFALEALAQHPSPYCMRLRYAFQTKEAFHLILPLAIGGDLKFHLRQGPFEEKRARFYAAEIALGVGHIHSLGFIMRDLKPRNILLDSEGHCKISDFGLAASIAQGRKVKGRAGTEGYWSPEVINSVPYGIDADWWSFGCCLFELLAGFNPFSCKHTGMPTRNEGTRKAPLKYTKNVPAAAKPLLQALLDRNVETRLGCRGKGVEEVLSPKFAFWRGMDMFALRRGTGKVPWVPEKGVIYAASQSEMLENDDDPNGAALRRVKLTQDDIPLFDDFVDLDSHMDDIVKVLHLNTDVADIVSDLLAQKVKDQKTLQRKLRKMSSAPAATEAPPPPLGCAACVIA